MDGECWEKIGALLNANEIADGLGRQIKEIAALCETAPDDLEIQRCAEELREVIDNKYESFMSTRGAELFAPGEICTVIERLPEEYGCESIIIPAVVVSDLSEGETQRRLVQLLAPLREEDVGYPYFPCNKHRGVAPPGRAGAQRELHGKVVDVMRLRNLSAFAGMISGSEGESRFCIPDSMLRVGARVLARGEGGVYHPSCIAEVRNCRFGVIDSHGSSGNKGVIRFVSGSDIVPLVPEIPFLAEDGVGPQILPAAAPRAVPVTPHSGGVVVISDLAGNTDEPSHCGAADRSGCEHPPPAGEGFMLWERYSSGVASKIMRRMGYIAHTGLGPRGRGIVESPTIQANRSVGTGLGFKVEKGGEGGKPATPRDPVRLQPQGQDRGQQLFRFLNNVINTGRPQPR